MTKSKDRKKKEREKRLRVQAARERQARALERRNARAHVEGSVRAAPESGEFMPGLVSPMSGRSFFPRPTSRPPVISRAMSVSRVQEVPPNLYLYLGERDWVGNWVDGGKVPIFRAAKYYDRENRSGRTTPDETLVHHSTIPVEKLRPYVNVGESFRGRLTITNCLFDGQFVQHEEVHDYYREHGFYVCRQS